MSGSSRERLIDAATSLFYEHGFHTIGLDRILDEVGVTKTTFYNHFESKDDLIIAVLRNRDRVELLQLLDDIRSRAGDDPRAALLAVFDVIEDWFADPSFRGCMFLKAAAEFPNPQDPIHKVASEHGTNIRERIVELGRRAGAADPELLATQLMIILSGAIVTTHASNSVDAGRLARSAAEMLIDRHVPPLGASVAPAAR